MHKLCHIYQKMWAEYFNEIDVYLIMITACTSGCTQCSSTGCTACNTTYFLTKSASPTCKG